MLLLLLLRLLLLLLLHRAVGRLSGDRGLGLRVHLRCLHLCSLDLSLDLRLLGVGDLGPLSACLFRLLLLLNTRGGGLVDGAGLQVLGRIEWAGVLVLSDEGMQLRLLRGPALKWVDVEEALDEVYECFSVCIFCTPVSTGSDQTASSPGESQTSINLALLHVLPWHGILSYDIFQTGGGEVLLTRLLRRVVLSRILLHRLQPIYSPTELIVCLVEEVSGLFAHLEHPGRR